MFFITNRGRISLVLMENTGKKLIFEINKVIISTSISGKFQGVFNEL